MKKIVTIILMVIIVASSGCCTNGNCGDGKPVAPNSYSSEIDTSGEPSFPHTVYWWE